MRSLMQPRSRGQGIRSNIYMVHVFQGQQEMARLEPAKGQGASPACQHVETPEARCLLIALPRGVLPDSLQRIAAVSHGLDAPDLGSVGAPRVVGHLGQRDRHRGCARAVRGHRTCPIHGCQLFPDCLPTADMVMRAFEYGTVCLFSGDSVWISRCVWRGSDAGRGVRRVQMRLALPGRSGRTPAKASAADHAGACTDTSKQHSVPQQVPSGPPPWESTLAPQGL